MLPKHPHLQKCEFKLCLVWNPSWEILGQLRWFMTSEVFAWAFSPINYQNQVDIKDPLLAYYRREDWQVCQIKAVVWKSGDLSQLTENKALDHHWKLHMYWTHLEQWPSSDPWCQTTVITHLKSPRRWTNQHLLQSLTKVSRWRPICTSSLHMMISYFKADSAPA